MKDAYFAGGCFWCITPIFASLKGVKRIQSGYMGGNINNPTYLDVKSQKYGFREIIKITYDEQEISYQDLLDTFIENVDPFDGTGQFIDKGYSYTLAIYYLDNSELEIAKKTINNLKEKSSKEVYISLEEKTDFYLAEEEHQDYYLKNPEEFEKELIISGRKKASN